MYNKINVYKGKLGKERFLMELPNRWGEISWNKKQLIVLPRDNPTDMYDSDVYVIQQVMIDTVHNEVSLFVELYEWED